MTMPTSRTSHKKSSVKPNKSRHPSQFTSPKSHKKHFIKYKREHINYPPTKKWCDYHNSSWHDMSEWKAWKKFLAKLSTFDLSNRTLVDSDLDASTLLAST